MTQINLFELKKRYKKLRAILESCQLCPRRCKINRLKGELGYCKAGSELMISSIGPHFGEEPELVGRGGSGTVFLTHCNLRCAFCQNYDISQLGGGRKTTSKDLAKGMIYLKSLGCHNINFVTPTHFVPQIVESIIYAKEQGLDLPRIIPKDPTFKSEMKGYVENNIRKSPTIHDGDIRGLPLVFNCGGYENVEVIKLLDGIFDIYMPDIKFASSELSKKYCNAEDYFDRAQEVVKEMHRQVGNLVVENGIAKRGLLIRHLVMPNASQDSQRILDFIASEISKDSYVNIMDQYRPIYKAEDYPEINRRITLQEYRHTLQYARQIGLKRQNQKFSLLT